MTWTSFQNAAVTNVHERNPEFSSKLAGFIAHNDSTARKYQVLSKKQRRQWKLRRNSGILCEATPRQHREPARDLEWKKKSHLDERRAWKSKGKLWGWNKWANHITTLLFLLKLTQVNNWRECHQGEFTISWKRVYLTTWSMILTSLRNCQRIAKNGSCLVRNNWKCKEQSSASIVSPIERSGMFSDEAIQTIKTIFSDMILLNNPISKPTIQKPVLWNERR